MVRSRLIGPRLGLPDLYFKNETANPTWSFKDRYVAVTVNVARQFGYRRAVVSSTGNLGVSTAAYCAAAGLECLLLVPPATPRRVLDHARLHGARVLVLPSAARQPVFERLALEAGWFPVGLFLGRRVHNPFGIEGYKPIAYEILAALGRAPGAVLFPCARGNGLYGAWKGFVEAGRFGWTARHPRVIACQPAAANSLEVSLARGAAEPVARVPGPSICRSTREAVADVQALAAIRRSGGTAASASDAEVRQAVADLAREGLAVEPSSALPVAALPRLLAAGAVPAAEPVVCVLTATGLRWPVSGRLLRATPEPLRVRGSADDARRALVDAGLPA
jgi:threonine synthase